LNSVLSIGLDQNRLPKPNKEDVKKQEIWFSSFELILLDFGRPALDITVSD